VGITVRGGLVAPLGKLAHGALGGGVALAARRTGKMDLPQWGRDDLDLVRSNQST
jgi:hypothetical protein